MVSCLLFLVGIFVLDARWHTGSWFSIQVNSIGTCFFYVAYYALLPSFAYKSVALFPSYSTLGGTSTRVDKSDYRKVENSASLFSNCAYCRYVGKSPKLRTLETCSLKYEYLRIPSVFMDGGIMSVASTYNSLVNSSALR